MTAQRARGTARVVAKRRGAASVIDKLEMSGSAKLLFPRAAGAALDAVFLNSAGGITGGDRFAIAAGAGPGADLRLTTQAAERVYRALPGGPPGRMETQLDIAPEARLTWLPQETILFDQAALSRRLRVDLAPGARFLGCETLVFGRAAMGETVRQVALSDHVDLWCGGDLVFADRLRIDGDAAAQLARPGVARAGLAVASVLWAAPEAAARLARLRALLPAGAGASALAKDLVFCRIVAKDGFEMRRVLVPLLQDLEGGALPRPWML